MLKSFKTPKNDLVGPPILTISVDRKETVPVFAVVVEAARFPSIYKDKRLFAEPTYVSRTKLAVTNDHVLTGSAIVESAVIDAEPTVNTTWPVALFEIEKRSTDNYQTE